MLLTEALVAVFGDYQEVDLAVARLVTAGITTAQVSIVGKGYDSSERASGFKSASGKIRFWGRHGPFWDGLWLQFGGGVSLTLPVIGHFMAVGPLAAIISSTVEGAVLSGGLTPLGAALYSCGIVRKSIAKYEQAVKADGFIVVVQGPPETLARARAQLAQSNPTQMDLHDGICLNPKVGMPPHGLTNRKPKPLLNDRP